MELSQDGDHIIWLNYAWVVVVGYVHHLPLSVSEPTNKDGPRLELRLSLLGPKQAIPACASNREVHINKYGGDDFEVVENERSVES